MERVYIGLDVHKEQIVIGVAGIGDAHIYGQCSSDIRCFMKAMRGVERKYAVERAQLRICYEAGPSGFALARHLQRIGYAVEVVAPSLIPTKAGERVKTDRRDAKKLARLYRAGELTAVHIPDAEDEVIRDLCRARTDAIDDQTRAKHRLMMFLLRNGHRYGGKTAWNDAHRRYLRELVLVDPIQKLILEEYLQAVDRARDRVESLQEQMRLRLEGWSRRPFVEALQGFKGFQLVAAMIVTSELGDLSRFKHPRQLMAYLGLVPSEHSSGNSRHQGSITKTGNSHVRWILVEVVHAYRLPPKVSTHLTLRQEKLHKSINALSWKAQKRLHARYVRLLMRRLHENKIKVAIAREMAAFIWELGRVMQDADVHTTVAA